MTEQQRQTTERYLKTRACKIKVQYKTRKIAKAKAKERSLIYKNGRIRAYKCKYCPYYHIGHNKYA